MTPTHTPFKLVAKMPRSGSYPLLSFLQYGRHSIFESICGLGLLGLYYNFIIFYNLLPHFPYVNIVKMGGEDLIYRVLTAYAISEFSHYDFGMGQLSVTPKHVKIPNN